MADCFITRRGGGGSGGIPVFSYSGSCELISDGGKDWRIKFYTSGTLRFSSLGNAKNGIQVFLVGGGGAGGSGHNQYHFGLGGSGGFNTLGTAFVEKDKDYTVTIGAGGAKLSKGATNERSDGGVTGAFGLEARGGGGGGNRNTANDGSTYATAPGGSGGGGWQGDGGSDGSDGKGAGAGIGEHICCHEFREANSGSLYCGGGAGCNSPSAKGGPGGGGAPDSDASPNSGGGGGGCTAAGSSGGAGGSGIVVIRNIRGIGT